MTGQSLGAAFLEVKVRRSIPASQSMLMANKMKHEPVVNGSACPGAIAAIRLPLYLDLDVDLGIDADHLFTKQAG
jgi:hypothetical protein